MNIKGVNDLERHVAELKPKLLAAASRVIERAWFVQGDECSHFEQAFATYCGVRHCVGVANGSDALELCLKCIGVQPGQCVATVANAGMYGTAAILACGARPVYVDIDADTLTISPLALRMVIDRFSPAAIIVTHLFGRLADMKAIARIATDADVPVVEDCAQAHGAERAGRKAGSFGTIAAFSFYPTKNLGALGDAGAVITDSAALAETLRRLRQYGWSKKYLADVPGGRNSRLDELQAAFLNELLPLIDGWNGRRREIATLYGRFIVNPKVSLPPHPGADDVVHLYVVRSSDRDGLRDHLRKAGIPTDVHYPVPDFQQKAFVGLVGENHECDATLRACSTILTLPCFPELTDAEVREVSEAVNSW